MRHSILAALAALTLCGGMGMAATAQTPVRRAANITTGCVDRFDPSADYFPSKVTIEDALNFTVVYRNSYKILTVKEAYSGGPREQYVLTQCGAPVPPLTGELAGAQVVSVPVASLFVLSTTHLALLADLDRVDVLAGVAQRDMVVEPQAEARFRAGRAIEFARAGIVDVERVVAARPSLLMSDGRASATLSVIRNNGIPVAADTEWLEPTALGRAEWLKYIALFLNEEGKAQAAYGAVKRRYESLRGRAAARPDASRPLIMTGRSSRGIFTIAGGRSYVAALIRDAGGRYAWADNASTGTASVDLEAQIQRSANADIWINGGGWKSLGAMLEDEPRYAAFKAFRQGQVWVYERRQTPAGGNDYWSRGVSHPDMVLADLVKIFHPTLATDHVFEWYAPVPSRQP